MEPQTIQHSWSDRVKGITSNSLQSDSSAKTDIQITTSVVNEYQVPTSEFPLLGSGASKQEANQEMTDSQSEENEVHLKGKSWADMFDDDDDDDIDEEIMAKLNILSEKKQQEEKEKTSKYLGGNHGTESSRWASAPDEPPRRSYYDNNRSNSTNYGSNYNNSNSHNSYNKYNKYNKYNNSGYSNNSSNNNSTYKTRADTSFRRSDEEADKIYNQLKSEIYGTPLPPPVEHSPESARVRPFGNSEESQKWNAYASTSSSPTPSHHQNRWNNDRYQSEPSTPPTGRKWTNEPYDPTEPSTKSSSSSRWANNASSPGNRWANDRYDPSGNTSSRWTNDRYRASSEEQTLSNNNKWINDRYNPSEDAHTANDNEQPSPQDNNNDNKWKNDRYKAPTREKTAGSQWSSFNNSRSNYRDQNRWNSNTSYNNDRRGFNNAEDRAFEQLKNEIYGTTQKTTTGAKDDDDTNNQQYPTDKWKKDDNEERISVNTSTSPKQNNSTSSSAASKWATNDASSSANSQWANISSNNTPRVQNRESELDHDKLTADNENDHMVKISNPNEGTHYWTEAAKPTSPITSISKVNESTDYKDDNAPNNNQWNAFAEMNTNVTKRENLPESGNTTQWVQVTNETPVNNDRQWTPPIPKADPETSKYQNGTVYTSAPISNKWTHDKFDDSIVNRSNTSSPDPVANKWVQWAREQT